MTDKVTIVGNGVITVNEPAEINITCTSKADPSVKAYAANVACHVTMKTITVTKLPATINDSHQLTYTYTPTVADMTSVTYTSSNPSAATISTTGLITVLKDATNVTFTVTSKMNSNIKGTATCNVHSTKITRIDLAAPNEVFDTGVIEVLFTPADTPNQEVTWTVEEI